MNRFAKISLALASSGGALLFTAAPMAFAATPDVSLSAAGSYQSQNGTDSWGSILNQSASVSAGSVSAENYYNSTTSNGFTGTQTTYNNQNGYSEDDVNIPVATSQDKTTNYGGTSWTKATDYTSQGATTSTSQSQNIDNYGYGAYQFSASAAVSGAGGSSGIAGGAAVNFQRQNGDNAYESTMNQTSSAQAGLTTANSLKSDTVNNGYTDTSTTWNNGSKTFNQTVTNYGDSSYTKADDYFNPAAGSTQSQSQNIGDNGYGGVQHQGQLAVEGQVGGFWLFAAGGHVR